MMQNEFNRNNITIQLIIYYVLNMYNKYKIIKYKIIKYKIIKYKIIKYKIIY